MARSVAGFYPPTLETKNRANAEVIGLRPVFIAWIRSARAEKPFNCLGLFQASVLRTEILEVVLGLLLGVLCAALGVRAGIQLVDGLV